MIRITWQRITNDAKAPEELQEDQETQISLQVMKNYFTINN
jgi:hypothetical protein